MKFVELSPDVLYEVTRLLQLHHMFKLWLVGSLSLCTKLLEGRGVRELRHTVRRRKLPLPISTFPLLLNLTHIEITRHSYHLVMEVNPEFFVALPRNLEFLSIQARNCFSAFQAMFQATPDHFQRLTSLVLITLGGASRPLQAEHVGLPTTLTTFQTNILVDYYHKLIIPPHLQDLMVSVQTIDHVLPPALTLQRLNIDITSPPSTCPILPSSITWLEFNSVNSDGFDSWDLSCLPSSLTHFAWNGEIRSVHLMTLPSSLRSLQLRCLRRMDEGGVMLLSRLVNLTRLECPLLFPFENHLCAYFPRQLHLVKAFVPLEAISGLPPSITELLLSYLPGDEKTVQSNNFSIRELFPSLKTLSSTRLSVFLLSIIPDRLETLKVDDQVLSLEMAQQLPSNLKSFYCYHHGGCAILEHEDCIASLPRTLTRLTGFQTFKDRRKADIFLNLSEQSSFNLPRSLTEMNVGPIQIPHQKWFLQLPSTLTSLSLDISTPPDMNFASEFVLPLYLVFFEIKLYSTITPSIVPLLQTIPHGVKRCFISLASKMDSNLTDADLIDFLIPRRIKHLLLPKSQLITDQCLPSLPRSFKVLDFEAKWSPPQWWPKSRL